MGKPRARDLGLDFGGEPGPHDAITDVPGVRVGFATLDAEVDPDGPSGPARTGVTAILPRPPHGPLRPVWAGFHALNGNGEMTGTHWIRHGGHFAGPVCLTNTHSVGIVHHAATGWLIDRHDEFRDRHLWAMPVVAETYDGVLNDINARHVGEPHALAAIDSARDGPVAEGNVGGGTGMIAYEYKGGTGTASRRIAIGGETFTLGVLVQANHGLRDRFTVLGVPLGERLTNDRLLERESGSIVAVIATDAPMLPHQLERVAARGSIGIGRHGTPGGNNSGDLFLAFSTANAMTLDELAASRRTMECLSDECFDALYLATVQAIDEAVVNAMLAAESMPTFRPPGRVCRAIDADELLSALRAAGAAA